MNTPETQPPASLGAAHGSAIRDVPAACQEIPGYILDVFDGSAWITQDGQVTDKWQERGIWTTPEAAAEMMERCLSPNAEVTHPESNPKTMPKKPTQSKPSRAEQASGEGLPSTALLGEFAFEAKFADGKTVIVYERTYSRACVRAQWLRLQDGAETHKELHIVSGKRRTDLDSPNEKVSDGR